jgi:hypothetical protein
MQGRLSFLCAMRSINLSSFKLIPLTLFEISTGQKYEKLQRAITQQELSREKKSYSKSCHKGVSLSIIIYNNTNNMNT